MQHESIGRIASWFALALLSCAACGSEPEKSTSVAAPPAERASAANAPGAEQASAPPAGHANPSAESILGGATRAPKPNEPTAPPPSGSLVVSAQPGWFTERPLNATRVAQYVLPRTGEDAEDATLVVSYFGGQGGSRDANVERWAGQFEQPDGRSSKDAMQSTERTVNGLRVFELELSGTYVAETSPGSGERHRKEGWRMLAAIVDAPLGPHYLKLTGPETTVRHWESSYRSFVSALKAQP